MNYKKLLIGSTLTFLIVNPIAQAAKEPTIAYKNQRGSTLTLIWHKEYENTGSLSGVFTTAVGNCKKDIGVPLPIVGYFNGNAISVTINFPHCKQVVAMTGNLNDDNSKLHTIWLDANQAVDPQGKNWNSNIIGSDTYEMMDSL